MTQKRKVYQTPEMYLELDKHSVGSRLKSEGDCSIMAIAIVAEIDYDSARASMMKHGYDPEKGAFRHQCVKALRDFGWGVQKFEISQLISHYPPSKRDRWFVTPRQSFRFASAWAKLPPRMLAWSAEHVSAVVNGIIIDEANSSSIHITAMDIVEKEAIKC